jgi:hypothetical protein
VSVLAYCWFASAEDTQLRRIAAAEPGLAAEVASFIDSARWVDMERVFKDSWLTGGSRSLKAIAPLAGHTWTVDDPGGGLAMVKHLEATLPEESPQREAASLRCQPKSGTWPGLRSAEMPSWRQCS